MSNPPPRKGAPPGLKQEPPHCPPRGSPRPTDSSSRQPLSAAGCCTPGSQFWGPLSQGPPDPPAPLQGLQHLHCPLTPLHGVPSPGRRVLLLQQPTVTGEAGWGHLPPWHSPEAARLPGDGSHHHGLRLGSVRRPPQRPPQANEATGRQPWGDRGVKGRLSPPQEGLGPGVEAKEEKKWGLWTS